MLRGVFSGLDIERRKLHASLWHAHNRLPRPRLNSEDVGCNTKTVAPNGLVTFLKAVTPACAERMSGHEMLLKLFQGA